jgi:hypothetical protein
MITDKAFIHYCAPFTKIDLKQMAATFPIDDLESKLEILISKNELPFLIDDYNKVFVFYYSVL